MPYCVMAQMLAAVAAAEAAAPEVIKQVETETSLADSLAAYLDGIWNLPAWASITTARMILVVATLVAAWLALRIVKYLIMGLGKKVLTRKFDMQALPRAHTLAQLFYSMAKYVVYFLAFITALYQASINPAPFLGGAAVIGLAVGFGSQDLVKDVVTGIFVLVENQFAIGEYVDLGGKSGVVTDMSVRIVTIRDDQGRLHNLPYRSISVVSNFSRSGAAMISDVFLANPEDGEKAHKLLDDGLATLSKELSPMIRTYAVEGIVNPGTPQALVRVRVNCRPNRAEFIQAEVTSRIKEVLAAGAVEIKNGLVRAYSAAHEVR